MEVAAFVEYGQSIAEIIYDSVGNMTAAIPDKSNSELFVRYFPWLLG